MSAAVAASTVFSWRSYRRPSHLFHLRSARHGPVLPSRYSADEISRTCQQHMQRVFARCLQVAGRCGGWLFAIMRENPSAEEDALRASELRKALVDLGPSFVKVGQLLSSRVDLLPRRATGHSEILEGRLQRSDDGGLITAKVLAGQPLFFEAAVACAPVGPKACGSLARQCRASPEVLEKVMKLPTGRFTGETRELEAALACNARECSREPGFVALFLACSRIPHSCCPNAIIDSAQTHAVLRALNDMDAGTTVKVSYVTVSLNRQARQSQLGQGFTCTCARCVAEESNDPQFTVACSSCKKGSLSLSREDPQHCKACGAKFVVAEALRHVQEAAKANAFMAKAESARGDAVQKAMALETRLRTATTSANPAPPRHPQILQLMNNVANCYFYAAQTPGSNQAACWAGFWTYKQRFMEGLEANHGPTKQRDLHYILSLRRMLSAKFSDREEREKHQKKFEQLMQQDAETQGLSKRKIKSQCSCYP
ncbi:putative SET domain-containing protein [Symbiodinium microadriaticum]|uniref:Putative SET domain-containing protein n=1 Tax=Symbiodinium microadriaticum TaxID=2951 RepID=A0A1Q9DUI0_SYMMI|nr:putative SET domain-containing protein [Symbiodinium microadriaticum]